MQKLESKFKVKVLVKLRSIPQSWWTSVNQISLRGTPDILGCISGKFIAIELKSSSRGVVSPIQAHTLEQIRTCGKGEAYVIHPDNFEEHFENLKQIGALNAINHTRGSLESTDTSYSNKIISCEDECSSELELDQAIEEICKDKARI